MRTLCVLILVLYELVRLVAFSENRFIQILRALNYLLYSTVQDQDSPPFTPLNDFWRREAPIKRFSRTRN